MELGLFKKCDNWSVKYDGLSLSFFSNVALAALFVSPSVFGLR
jgi:hypothetical protein